MTQAHRLIRTRRLALSRPPAKLYSWTVALAAVLLLAGSATGAQTVASQEPRVLDARARWETLNLIRQEKLDLILPGAMRDNHIDMWIHSIRMGNPDPLELDLGAEFGTFVFTDRGGDRIERIVLSPFHLHDRSVYDRVGDLDELRAIVDERDPQRIAINSSEWIGVADGMSHTDYLELLETLGPVYSERLVSADQLITDFRVRRVDSEIAAFAAAGEMTRRLFETALSNEVIVPGVTTPEDVGWWVQERLLEMGVRPSFGISTPGISRTAEGGRGRRRGRDEAIQRGDFISYDMGIRYLNFGTDFKRHAYVLREGEAAPPADIQHAWQRGYRARQIIKDNIKVGRTAGETLAHLAAVLVAEGYVYTPFVDDERDRDIINALGSDPRTGISIDCHTVGNTGNSEAAVGPSFAPFRPDRAHVIIQPNNIFSLEFVAHTAMDDGTRMAINFEDNAIVTERGVEWLYPPNSRILLIR
jgi:Xaa-Pro aminopeptidase